MIPPGSVYDGGIEEQEVGQRRLRAFDLGREEGLLADVEVDEQVRVREHRCDAVEAAQGTVLSTWW